MSEDFTLFFVLTLWAVHVTIVFCSSCGCLWERVTVKTRFHRPKRLSIFVLINIFCGLERSLHPFGPDFDTIFNSLLLSDSTLTNISIRNIWVTDAKYSCASIGRLWFAIRDFVAVQAPVELKKTFQFSHAGHVTEFPNFSCLSTRWRRRRSGAFGGKWLCWIAITNCTGCMADSFTIRRTGQMDGQRGLKNDVNTIPTGYTNP